MRITRQTYANTSRKPAPEGVYIGVICGFCDLGFQEGQYGSRQQVMIRWELRDTQTGDPINDDEDKPFTVNAPFPFTINDNLDGQPSKLSVCLVAHGINLDSGEVETKELKGHCALLEVGADTTGNYSRVFDVQPLEDKHKQLGRDGKLKRALAFEHWEGDDKPQPPGWAWGLLKQGHLANRVPGAYAGPGRPQGQQPGRPGQQPAANGGAGTTASGYKQYADDEESIPF